MFSFRKAVYFHLNFHVHHVFQILIAQRIRIYVELARRNEFYIRIIFNFKTIIKNPFTSQNWNFTLCGGIGILYVIRYIFTLE